MVIFHSYTALHYITLHYATLCYITLHCTKLLHYLMVTSLCIQLHKLHIIQSHHITFHFSTCTNTSTHASMTHIQYARVCTQYAHCTHTVHALHTVHTLHNIIYHYIKVYVTDICAYLTK